MITGLLLKALGLLLGWLTALLPEGDLVIDVSDSWSAWITEYAGPLDRWFPVRETFQALVIFFGIWLPSTMVYTVTHWVYRHLPVIGKG